MKRLFLSIVIVLNINLYIHGAESPIKRKSDEKDQCVKRPCNEKDLEIGFHTKMRPKSIILHQLSSNGILSKLLLPRFFNLKKSIHTYSLKDLNSMEEIRIKKFLLDDYNTINSHLLETYGPYSIVFNKKECLLNKSSSPSTEDFMKKLFITVGFKKHINQPLIPKEKQFLIILYQYASTNNITTKTGIIKEIIDWEEDQELFISQDVSIENKKKMQDDLVENEFILLKSIRDYSKISGLTFKKEHTIISSLDDIKKEYGGEYLKINDRQSYDSPYPEPFSSQELTAINKELYKKELLSISHNIYLIQEEAQTNGGSIEDRLMSFYIEKKYDPNIGNIIKKISRKKYSDFLYKVEEECLKLDLIDMIKLAGKHLPLKNGCPTVFADSTK